MSRKNLKKTSLADALLIDHAALTELNGVHDQIYRQTISTQLANIHTKKHGEQAYPPMIMCSKPYCCKSGTAIVLIKTMITP
jgi:hypothetical protein